MFHGYSLNKYVIWSRFLLFGLLLFVITSCSLNASRDPAPASEPTRVNVQTTPVSTVIAETGASLNGEARAQEDAPASSGAVALPDMVLLTNTPAPVALAAGMPVVASTQPPRTGALPSTPVPAATLPPAPRVPQPAAPNQIVIQFNEEASQQERAAFVDQLGGTVTERIEALDTVVVELPEAVGVPALPGSDLVAASEPNYYVTALVDVPTSDTHYAEQWALPVIGAPKAWMALAADAPLVTVAVIDSGVCLDHPDLEGRILTGWDYVEGEAAAQDGYGHGCGVAGIIAANIDNGIGIAGVAPNARILPLRVLNSSGVGLYSDVAAAIVEAADRGAQVINLSLGGNNSSSVMESAVSYAVARGVTVVAAAGNSGAEGVLYPAAYAGVIAVGAMDEDLEPSSFSNWGDAIDLWAPGRNIYSTRNGGSYGLMSGTSFAAPHIAGIVALGYGNGFIPELARLPSSTPDIALGDVTPEATPTERFFPYDNTGILPPSGLEFFNGDILVPAGEASGQFTYEPNLWPNGIVPYVFSSGLTTYQRNQVGAAMDIWESVANVQFVPRTNQTGYVYINSGSGNYATVGNSGVSGQTFVIYNWDVLYVIVHELGHTLGMWHEQSAPDRNNYVRIEYANIETGQSYNFDAHPNAGTSGPYDFDSVMHYYAYAFSKNGLRTITVLPAYAQWQSVIDEGNYSHLSTYDAQGMAAIYGPPGNRPPNDLIDYVTVIGSLPYTTSLNHIQTATTTGSDPVFCVTASKTVWYHYTPSYNQMLTLSTVGSNYDTVLAIFNSSLVRIDCDDDGGGNYTSLLSNVSVKAGTTYYIGVGGWGTGPTSTASLVLNVTGTSAAPLTVGNTFQDSEGSVSYSGNWGTVTNGVYSSGTMRFSGQPGASASFPVTGAAGNRLTILRSTGPDRGMMRVCIGAGVCQTFSNYSIIPLYQQPLTLLLPNAGSFPVTLTHEGSSGQYLDFDSVSLASSPTALMVGNSFQNNNANINYSGQWQSTSNANHSGGTAHYTGFPNNGLTFLITANAGDRLTIVRSTGADKGQMRICFSEMFVCQTVSNSSEYGLFQQAHTMSVPWTATYPVTITFTGNHGQYLDLDLVSLQAAPVPLTLNNTYQDNNANLSYNGQWQASDNPIYNGGSVRYIGQPNASVSLMVNASAGQYLVIERSLGSDKGAMEVYFSETFNCQTISNYSATMQYQRPVSIALPWTASYTVTIRFVGTVGQYLDLDSVRISSVAVLEVLEEATEAALAAETTAEPEATAIVTATWTDEPEATAAVTETAVPETTSTLEPSVTSEMTATAEPSPALEPTATAEPSPTLEPSATSEPTPSAEPSPTLEPSATAIPEATAPGSAEATLEPMAAELTEAAA